MRSDNRIGERTLQLLIVIGAARNHRILVDRPLRAGLRQSILVEIGVEGRVILCRRDCEGRVDWRSSKSRGAPDDRNHNRDGRKRYQSAVPTARKMAAAAT